MNAMKYKGQTTRIIVNDFSHKPPKPAMSAKGLVANKI
jgi:hypothetical protein